jgi:hypothetical protein
VITLQFFMIILPDFMITLPPENEHLARPAAPDEFGSVLKSFAYACLAAAGGLRSTG